jgi:outer membrane protein
MMLILVGLALQVRVLTLDEAVNTAAKNQPQIRQAVGQTEAARGRVLQAEAPIIPTVTGAASYQRATANGRINAAAAGMTGGGDSFDSFDSWNFGLTASWLAFDFNQTRSRWHAAEASAQAQEITERTTQAAVLLGVRLAFFNARAQKDLVKVAKDTLDNQQRHLEQIQKFVSVGTRPEIDLAQARTDVANARVQLIRSENGYETAKAQLVQAMGVENVGTDFDVGDESLPAVEGEDGTIDQLLPEALRGRPEFASLQAQVRAQELTLTAASRGELPSLRLSAGVNESGSALDSLDWNWNVLVSLTWPIYDGGLTRGREREAQGTLHALQAQVDLERQQVRLEVEQARLAVREAKAEVSASAEALVNAQERLRLAEGRYQAGVGSIIELGDAQVALTTAAGQKVQSDYNVSNARAQMLRALGH